MSLEWTLPDDAGRWPVRGPLFTVRLLVLAIAIGGALMWLQYRRLTPLQQTSLPNYLYSRGASAVGLKSGTYTLLMTREGHSHLATADDLSRDVPLVWRQVEQPHARLSDDLQRWIFEHQTLTDLVWWPAIGTALVFVVGLLFAIPKDITRWRERRQGMRMRGPELVTPATFTKRLKGDGYGFRLGKGTVKR